MRDTFLKKLTWSWEATVYLSLYRTRICHHHHHDDLNTTPFNKIYGLFSSRKVRQAELDSRKVHESTDSVLSCSCAALQRHCHGAGLHASSPGALLLEHCENPGSDSMDSRFNCLEHNVTGPPKPPTPLSTCPIHTFHFLHLPTLFFPAYARSV